MKLIKTTAAYVLFALCALCSLPSLAQTSPIPLSEPDYNKPHIFSDLPVKMSIHPVRIETLLNLGMGSSTKTFLTDDFYLLGRVISRADEGTHKSVVIRCLDRAGVTLTLTRTQDHNGATRYIGRILSLDNGDAFDLVAENGQYYFQKKNLYDIISK